MVIRSRVVYVRGTPACGKSALAELLHRHTLETRGYLKVHSFTWEQTDDPWFEYLNRQSGLACLKAKDWASMKDTLIIIDEVQASFNDTGLWSDLIKPMSERPLKAGPMIVIFGSYGSPLVGPRRDNADVPLLQTKEFHSSLTSTFHSLRLFNKKAQSQLLNLVFFQPYRIQWRSNSLSTIVEYWRSAFHSVDGTLWVDMGYYMWAPRGCQSTIDHSNGSPGVEAISQGPKNSTFIRCTDSLKWLASSLSSLELYKFQ